MSYRGLTGRTKMEDLHAWRARRMWQILTLKISKTTEIVDWEWVKPSFFFAEISILLLFFDLRRRWYLFRGRSVAGT